MTSLELLKAINFAAIKHRDQRRKDSVKTPYVNHPVGVALILSEEGGVDDLITLQAAILHDTVEDTDTSLDEISLLFGEEVMNVVKEVTDDKALPKKERKLAQVTHAPFKSNRAKLVKLADKAYNLRDLQREIPQGWTQARVSEYFEWAQKVTSGCAGVNPLLDRILEEIYEAGPSHKLPLIKSYCKDENSLI